MKGHEFRDLVASYVLANFGQHGITVYTEVSLGKTIIGKDRRVDVFLVRESDQRALALECKFQGTSGTTDEKVPYALADIEAMWVPGCVVYAGDGWSSGVLHTLEGSRHAVFCLPDANLKPSRATRELDHVVASVFGLWSLIIPASRKFSGSQPIGERLPTLRADSARGSADDAKETSN